MAWSSIIDTWIWMGSFILAFKLRARQSLSLSLYVAVVRANFFALTFYSWSDTDVVFLLIIVLNVGEMQVYAIYFMASSEMCWGKWVKQLWYSYTLQNLVIVDDLLFLFYVDFAFDWISLTVKGVKFCECRWYNWLIGVRNLIWVYEVSRIASGTLLALIIRAVIMSFLFNIF